MRVTVAAGAGFCFGVRRALKIAFEAVRRGDGAVVTLGPIIHNPQVVARLEEEGLRVVSDLAQESGGTLIVRSHGLPKSSLDEACEKGMEVVDATCPFVKQAQERAAQLEDEGHFVIVVGEKDHPEVLSITGGLKRQALVVDGTRPLPDLPEAERYGVVSQTTQPQEHLLAVVGQLLERTRELKVFNTICDATFERQESALELAHDVDVMLVVGGRNSANTRRLWELCVAAGCDAHQIETAEEVDPEWFQGKEAVGITGGASTPQWIIDEVVEAVAQM
ncbi:MAG: 4-hydroxy-3-methylbut-2-enyl diphosphate reductase [Candidatus Eisenbacteria bacterium]|nr:4-hydroxy-3-methylbut-2-enyl diphosphate reductase [Candidatus Eisenbacteria bacterium]